MTELKPCPFCGGKPHIEKNLYFNTWELKHTCKKSDPQFNIYSGGYKTYEDVIINWNKRSKE